MTVESPLRASTFSTQLDSSLQKVGCALAGGDPQSIAKAVLSESAVRQHILTRLLQEVDEECARVCRRQPVSVFRKVTSAQMESFSWDWYIQELETKCPILYRILGAVVTHSDHRNTLKKGSAHHPGICMAAAVLLKERNREMVGVQSYLSLVLFNSRVQKNVSWSCVMGSVNTCTCKINALYVGICTHPQNQTEHMHTLHMHTLHTQRFTLG